MDDELALLILRFGIPSTIYVPITMAGRPFAVIVFATAGPRVYNEHDLVFAEELARRASTAMHNAELFQTAKKERERAEEAAELRERLVAVVGHDLRQPLAVDRHTRRSFCVGGARIRNSSKTSMVCAPARVACPA